MGHVAGNPDSWGYIQVSLDGRVYPAHHLVWFMHTGKWPKHELDHRDLDKANNRHDNLRPATRKQNASNCKVRSHSKSGMKGVYVMPNGKSIAQITVNRKSIYLGTFAEKWQAALAYANAACRFFGEFADPHSKMMMGAA